MVEDYKSMQMSEKNNAEDRANDLHNRQFGTNFKRREVESKGFDDTTHIKEKL